MQNKPNLQKVKMNLNFYPTKDYENKRLADMAKTKPIKANTKPIQTQYKPNSLDAQMNVTSILTKDYEEKCG